MRPPRIAILALFFAACVFLLCRALTLVGQTTPVASVPPSTQKQSTFRSFLSFPAPFSLFPPNAIITIADDNSTSFAARPAAFGPPLPGRGLNGRLWIGSGFTEETLQDGEGEGELGCSDVPGWDGGNPNAILKTVSEDAGDKTKPATAAGKTKNQRRHGPEQAPAVDRAAATESESRLANVPVDDGTDDYLHRGANLSPASSGEVSGSLSSDHADIQSIQEGAEIAGKIVLLSRGGCGFLEKVKWAQRRGATALIVGDNQRGGPLIQMFARRDTSNVTIPSIFTSRTTAYLLSLMMQPGSFVEDIIDESGNPSLKVQHTKNRKSKQPATVTTGSPRAVDTPRPDEVLVTNKEKKNKSTAGTIPFTDEGPEGQHWRDSSWSARIFSWGSRSQGASEKSRPPSSGRLDWVLVEDFSDEKDKVIKNSLEKAKSNARSGLGSSDGQSSQDDFQIGVEDWRDPDLVGSVRRDRSQPIETSSETASKAAPKAFSYDTTEKQDDRKIRDSGVPKGGSITPGSGEYHAKGKAESKSTTDESGSLSNSGGLMSRIFGGGERDASSQPGPINTPIAEKPLPGRRPGISPSEHEDLWVVITPTSGASPFFDTLLVLVISPLITLTVVYALLILRARIRRRRWRAPKSVVERLPVRTYHTVASTPSVSPRLPSPTSSSPTTPLLQSQHAPSRPRPRSRTTSGIPSSGDLLQVDSGLQIPRNPPSGASHEKAHSQVSSEWKKYMGRQVECVVCLEEYVDGISQVMSLPCGHEFHVECITPWLTTRRRTCPICKGDVVRSLARPSSSSPRYEPYRDDSEDDMLPEVPGSSLSPSTSHNDTGRDSDSDVEQGLFPSRRPGSRSRPEGWLGLLSPSFRQSPAPQTGRSTDRRR